MSLLRFSIIIPVRTINDYLRENLEHLQQLEYPHYEVIVITDNEETLPVDDPRYKCISSGAEGPGTKRNLGAKIAQGDVLAFLDDDAFPAPDWLTHASRLFKEYPGMYALGAPAITPPGSPLLEALSGHIYASPLTAGNTSYRYLPQKRRSIDDYPTVNLFVRKDAFDMVGGFPMEFWPGEDTKLCLDLLKHFDMPFLYDPAPKVYHHRRNVLLPHLKQLSRYGRHRGQFARIFPETSLWRPYFVPSLFVLGLVLGPLLSFGFPVLWRIYFSVLALYFGLVLFESLRIAFLTRSLLALPITLVGIFLTHIVYGVSFLWGFIKRPTLKLRDVDASGNYIGG